MINLATRHYDYFTLGDRDAYGQAILSEKKGTIKMAINLTSQANTDNIKYSESSYIGLTLSPIDDTYVIQFGDERLKVNYVNPLGRYKQVFMSEML